MPASRTTASFYLSGRVDESVQDMYNDSLTSDPYSFAYRDIESNRIGVGPLSYKPFSFPASPSTPSSSSSSSPTSSLPNDTKTSSRRRDPNHIPRPRNAFILFRSEYIKQEQAKGIEDGQIKLSKQAATVWNNMAAEQKRPYHELAALEKEEHARKYPGYVYAPKRRNGTNLNAKRNGRRCQQDRGTRPLPSSPNMYPVESVELASTGPESLDTWSFPQIALHNHSSFVDRMSIANHGQYDDPFGICSAPDLSTLPPLPQGVTMTADNDAFARFSSSNWLLDENDKFEDIFPDLFGTSSTANLSVFASNAATTSTTSTTTFTSPYDFASLPSFDFPFPSSHLDSVLPDFTNSFDARQCFNL